MTISAERREQNRKYRRNKKLKHYFATFFTFAVIAWALIMMLPSKEIKTLNGKLINRSAISTGKYSGTHPRAFVELENGKKITATIPKNFIFVDNIKVKVSARTSYLGFKTYSVLWKSKEQ